VSVEALATQPDRAATGPAGHASLLGRLDALLRHEFRVDVLVPAADDPILGTPACEVSGCVHSSRYGGLCLAHLRRWNLEDRPDRRAWVASADPAVMGHRPLQPCQVIGCGYGQHQYRLCYRHSRAWDKAGRPTVDQWTPTLVTMTSVCALPGCSLWAELDGGWCRSHHARWRQRGRPPAAEFIAYCTSYGEDQFDLGPLPPQLRLEIQYAIQCRVDANRTRTTPRSIKPLLDHLAVDGATVSLLDHSVQDWLARLPAAASTTSPRAFLGFAIDCLLDVRDGTGWDSEYPRDVWLLRRLGVAAGHGARLDFTPVQPRWLRELAKRWCRWRISCGIGLGQLRKDLIAIVRLSRLTPGLAASPGPAALDRAALETYLAQLAVAVPHAKTRSSDISSVAGLLRAVRQHRWARLPAEAELYPGDYPRRAEVSAPRAIPEFVMNQLESADNLVRLTDPRIRLLVEILIRTGLRIGRHPTGAGLPDPRPSGSGLPPLPQPQDAPRRRGPHRRRTHHHDRGPTDPRPTTVPRHQRPAATWACQPRRSIPHPHWNFRHAAQAMDGRYRGHRRIQLPRQSHTPPVPAHLRYLYWQGAREIREFGGVTRRCLMNIRYFQARPLRLSRELVPR